MTITKNDVSVYLKPRKGHNGSTLFYLKSKTFFQGFEKNKNKNKYEISIATATMAENQEEDNNIIEEEKLQGEE